MGKEPRRQRARTLDALRSWLGTCIVKSQASLPLGLHQTPSGSRIEGPELCATLNTVIDSQKFAQGVLRNIGYHDVYGLRWMLC